MKEDYLFEWDEAKNATNRRKHGISFEEAEAIWDDPGFVEVHVMDIPEDRWVAIGRVGKRAYFTAAITYREGRIRIISARRSSRKEIDKYGKD